MKAHTSIRVVNCCSTSFWVDKWLAHSCLKDLFPNIFGVDLQQEKTVDGGRSTHGWNFRFRRSLNDWEVDTLVELFRTQEEFKGTKVGRDRLWWKVDSRGCFRVGSTNKLLNRDL